jgi:hypothetical protein
MASIAMDIMSLDSSGYNKPIPSCRIKTLTETIKKECGKESPYSLINKENKYKIENLHNKFNKEITSFYDEFKSTKGNQSENLIDKSSIDSTCKFSDRMALQVSNSVKSSKLNEYIKDNRELIDSSPEKSLNEILFPLSIEDEDENSKKKRMADQNLLSSDPYFRELLEMKDINQEMLSNLPSSLINNPKSQEKIARKLALKCQRSYDNAVTALCKSDIETSILSYKDARASLRENKEYDIIKQTQYLSHLCNEPNIKNISANIKLMNEALPLSQIKQKDAKAIAEEQYNDSYVAVRKTICEFIPPQSASLQDGLEKMGCTNGKLNSDCIYLESYRMLFPKEDSQNDNNGSSSKLSSNDKKKSKRNSSNRFSKPSALVSNFIEKQTKKKIVLEKTEPIKENNTKKKPSTKSVKKVSNSKTVKKGTKPALTSKTVSNRTIQPTSQSGYLPTTQYQENQPEKKISNLDKKNKEMNQFFNEYKEKLERSKAAGKYTKSSNTLDKANKILNESEKKLDEAKKILSNADLNNQSTKNELTEPFENTKEEEGIKNHQYEDEHFGSAPKYSSSNRSPSGKKNQKWSGSNSKISPTSISKGYGFPNIFDNTVELKGLEGEKVKIEDLQDRFSKTTKQVVGDNVLIYTFLGSLENNPDKIDLFNTLTLDSSKEDIHSMKDKIIQKKPFYIKSAALPNEMILVQFVNGKIELIKDSENETSEFKAFYRKVKKAFRKKFYAKKQLMN